MRMWPLARAGEFARSLEACREGHTRLHAALCTRPRVAPLFANSTSWYGQCGRRRRRACTLARAVFDAAASDDLHLALATFHVPWWNRAARSRWDTDHVLCLRACVLGQTPRWMPEIVKRLRAAIAAAA
jgi:hypothetical protein